MHQHAPDASAAPAPPPAAPAPPPAAPAPPPAAPAPPPAAPAPPPAAPAPPPAAPTPPTVDAAASAALMAFIQNNAMEPATVGGWVAMGAACEWHAEETRDQVARIAQSIAAEIPHGRHKPLVEASIRVSAMATQLDHAHQIVTSRIAALTSTPVPEATGPPMPAPAQVPAGRGPPSAAAPAAVSSATTSAPAPARPASISAPASASSAPPSSAASSSTTPGAPVLAAAAPAPLGSAQARDPRRPRHQFMPAVPVFNALGFASLVAGGGKYPAQQRLGRRFRRQQQQSHAYEPQAYEQSASAAPASTTSSAYATSSSTGSSTSVHPRHDDHHHHHHHHHTAAHHHDHHHHGPTTAAAGRGCKLCKMIIRSGSGSKRVRLDAHGTSQCPLVRSEQEIVRFAKTFEPGLRRVKGIQNIKPGTGPDVTEAILARRAQRLADQIEKLCDRSPEYRPIQLALRMLAQLPTADGRAHLLGFFFDTLRELQQAAMRKASGIASHDNSVAVQANSAAPAGPPAAAAATASSRASSSASVAAPHDFALASVPAPPAANRPFFSMCGYCRAVLRGEPGRIMGQEHSHRVDECKLLSYDLANRVKRCLHHLAAAGLPFEFGFTSHASTVGETALVRCAEQLIAQLIQLDKSYPKARVVRSGLGEILRFGKTSRRTDALILLFTLVLED
ncbi:hypothetical protein H9P43_005315 [Blastocladiella emersonii ATCC 22665]|nr:hypothetical protein H9P43_005286 [Blastocladiella emersonii ATCC 22665]KAI9179983.1 hypothetical protein H9P43_005315 [Blastocladiella emersonii ATCC 22665]